MHLRQSQGTSFTRQAPHGNQPAPGTDTPRHAHLPLSSLGLPLHIHTPHWAGFLEAGGRGKSGRSHWVSLGGWEKGSMWEADVDWHWLWEMWVASRCMAWDVCGVLNVRWAHETCMGTCHVVVMCLNPGLSPIRCGHQSYRLGARPLRCAPTQQAQKCLHKVQLR